MMLVAPLWLVTVCGSAAATKAGQAAALASSNASSGTLTPAAKQFARQPGVDGADQASGNKNSRESRRKKTGQRAGQNQTVEQAQNAVLTGDDPIVVAHNWPPLSSAHPSKQIPESKDISSPPAPNGPSPQVKSPTQSTPSPSPPINIPSSPSHKRVEEIDSSPLNADSDNSLKGSTLTNASLQAAIPVTDLNNNSSPDQSSGDEEATPEPLDNDGSDGIDEFEEIQNINQFQASSSSNLRSTPPETRYTIPPNMSSTPPKFDQYPTGSPKTKLSFFAQAPASTQPADQFPVKKCKLKLDTNLKGGSYDPHYKYYIEIYNAQNPNKPHKIYRRYNDVKELHATFEKVMPYHAIPSLPEDNIFVAIGKKFSLWLGIPSELSKRAEELENYLNIVCDNKYLANHYAMLKFIGIHYSNQLYPVPNTNLDGVDETKNDGSEAMSGDEYDSRIKEDWAPIQSAADHAADCITSLIQHAGGIESAKRSQLALKAASEQMPTVVQSGFNDARFIQDAVMMQQDRERKIATINAKLELVMKLEAYISYVKAQAQAFQLAALRAKVTLYHGWIGVINIMTAQRPQLELALASNDQNRVSMAQAQIHEALKAAKFIISQKERAIQSLALEQKQLDETYTTAFLLYTKIMTTVTSN